MPSNRAAQAIGASIGVGSIGLLYDVIFDKVEYRLAIPPEISIFLWVTIGILSILFLYLVIRQLIPGLVLSVGQSKQRKSRWPTWDFVMNLSMCEPSDTY